MREIVIYVDHGVSGDSLRHTVKSLQAEVDIDLHPIVRLDAQALIEKEWEKSAALLIVPGGRDVYYQRSLEGRGTAKIRRFVEEGGRYLGICAGAYFGSAAIEFEKGGRLEVVDKRSLGFFPGVAVGSALGVGKYAPDSALGADTATLAWEQQTCKVFYNGGCFFQDAAAFPEVEVLARYQDLADAPAALISCKMGRGQAILTGVHLEYSAHSLGHGGSAHIERLAPVLMASETTRRSLFRHLLSSLNLNLKREER